MNRGDASGMFGTRQEAGSHARHPDPNDFARVQSDNPSGANSTELWVIDLYCNRADALSSDCIVFRSKHVSP